MTGDRTGMAPVEKPPYVKFVDVQKTYDGTTAVVADLNLTVERGEFLTLLGPSGSGKTTTLMMLAGFEQPTGGEILLEGAPLSRVPPHRRDFGVVFQDYALFPHMTVADNVAFPLKARRLSRGETVDRVVAALELVQLGGLGARRPNQLSGGQQQRVALARALVFQPRLVLMDEPLGALDKQLREQLQLEIKHIQQALNLTVVYVTHDQQEALTLSNRIAVFNGGRVLQVDTPAALYERPETSFVAHFIGESNRLSGVIEGLEGPHCLVALDGGGRVTARPGAIGAVRLSRTTLSVRPERVALNAAAEGLPNRFVGTVEELIYQGDATRVRVCLTPTVRNFMVRVPNAGRQPALRAGDPITVGWSADDCRALDG
jgi:putative spermidine/putrescine transport system ATP-binding protein